MNGLDQYTKDDEIKASDLSEESNASSFYVLHQNFNGTDEDNNPYSYVSESANIYKLNVTQESNDLFKDKSDFNSQFKANKSYYADFENSEEEKNRKLFGAFSQYMFYVLPSREGPKKLLSFLQRKLIVKFDAKRKRFVNKMVKSESPWATNLMSSMLDDYGWKEDYNRFLVEKEAFETGNKVNDFSKSFEIFDHSIDQENESATVYSKEAFKQDKDWFYLGLRNKMTRQEQFVMEQKLFDEFSLFVMMKSKSLEQEGKVNELSVFKEATGKFVDAMYGDGLNENFWGQAKYFRLRSKYFPDYKDYLTEQRDIIKDGLVDVLDEISNKIATTAEIMKGFLDQVKPTNDNVVLFVSEVEKERTELIQKRADLDGVLSEYAPELRAKFLSDFDNCTLQLDNLIVQLQQNLIQLDAAEKEKQQAVILLGELSEKANLIKSELLNEHKITGVNSYLKKVAQFFIAVENAQSECLQNIELNHTITSSLVEKREEVLEVSNTSTGLMNRAESVKQDEILRRESEIGNFYNNLSNQEVEYLDDKSGGASFDVTSNKTPLDSPPSEIPIEVYLQEPILRTVGIGGVNRTADIEVVQRLLIKNGFNQIKLNGTLDEVTKSSILNFQRDTMKIKKPDGRIDPGRGSFWYLVLGRKTSKIERNIFNVEMFSDVIESAGEEFGIPPIYLKAIMAVESGGRPDASSGSAWGLMQILKGTWEGRQEKNEQLKQFNFSDYWFVPEVNVRFGAAVLKSKAESMKVGVENPNFVSLAVTAYNGGQGVVTDALKNAREGGSLDPEKDFLKPEFLKPAIANYSSVYSYYTTGKGSSSNTDEDKVRGAIDLKYKEISRYAPKTLGYLEYFGRGGDYSLVHVPSIGKKQISLDVTFLISQLLSGAITQQKFDENFEVLISSQTPSAYAAVKMLSTMGVADISEKFVGNNKAIYESETPEYYQNLIQSKEHVTSYLARLEEEMIKWKNKQNEVIEERKIQQKRQQERLEAKNEIKVLEEQFNCNEISLKEFCSSLLVYMDVYGKEVIDLSNRMDPLVRRSMYTQLLELSNVNGVSQLDAVYVDLMTSYINQPTIRAKNQEKKVEENISKNRSGAGGTLSKSIYDKGAKMLDNDYYQNGHAYIAFTGPYSKTKYKKGDKISLEDAIIQYRSKTVKSDMISGLNAKNLINPNTGKAYKAKEKLTAEHAIEYYREAQLEKPLPTWCNQFLFDFADQHISEDVFGDMKKRTSASGMLKHMQDNTEKFQKLSTFEECWNRSNAGDLVILATSGHVSTVYPTPTNDWKTSDSDNKDRKFGKVVQAGRTIGVVYLNHAWRVSDFDDIEMFVYKPGNGAIENVRQNGEVRKKSSQRAEENRSSNNSISLNYEVDIEAAFGKKLKPKEFLETFGPIMVNATKGTSLLPSVKLAQCALETGWGEKTIGEAKNLFGIKASGKTTPYWDGSSVSADTPENYGDGRKIYHKAFRKYDTYENSVLDHSHLLLTLDRYEIVRKAKTAEEQAKALKEAGYATGKNYATKLISIINKYGFKALDQKKLSETQKAQEIGNAYIIPQMDNDYLGNLMPQNIYQRDDELNSYSLSLLDYDLPEPDEFSFREMQAEFNSWFETTNPEPVLNYEQLSLDVKKYWKSQGGTSNCDLFAKKVIDGQTKDDSERYASIGSIQEEKTTREHSFHIMWEKDYKKGTKRKQGTEYANDMTTMDADLKERKMTIQYIHACLEHGIPAQVGVNHTYAYKRASGNQDKTTDHWLVIDGKGSDEKGNYFTYIDPGRSAKSNGTNSEKNRLYQDKNNEWIWKDPEVYSKTNYVLVAVTLYSEHRNKDKFSFGRFNFNRTEEK